MDRSRGGHLCPSQTRSSRNLFATASTSVNSAETPYSSNRATAIIVSRVSVRESRLERAAVRSPVAGRSNSCACRCQPRRHRNASNRRNPGRRPAATAPLLASGPARAGDVHLPGSQAPDGLLLRQPSKRRCSSSGSNPSGAPIATIRVRGGCSPHYPPVATSALRPTTCRIIRSSGISDT